MEMWRKVWRLGIEPQLSTSALEALKIAIAGDDPTLIQGSTCYPPNISGLELNDCEGACGIGFAGWKGGSCKTVKEVEQYLQRVCDGADRVFNEPAACRYFLNWFDDTPRTEMRKELFLEISVALDKRKAS